MALYKVWANEITRRYVVVDAGSSYEAREFARETIEGGVYKPVDCVWEPGDVEEITDAGDDKVWKVTEDFRGEEN